VTGPLWQLDDVAVQDGPTRRLGPLSLAIPPGVTAVLGGSGAGKTTLLEVLVGFTRPRHGRVRAAVAPRGRVPLFWAPEDGGLWPHLTVREHLDVAGAGAAACGVLLRAFDLDDCAARRPGSLSLGEIDRVNVARALATGAAVLVMDEPLAHVDPARAGRYWHALRVELERTGASLVFATHQARRAIELAATAVCLADGALSFCGAIERLHRAPPTEALAWALGETNWLEPAEAERWLGRPLAQPSLRPEQIDVTADERGPAAVTRSRHLGELVQSELRLPGGAERTFYHRSGPALAPGTNVAVRLLALGLACVAALLAGCADTERPVLAFAHVRHVPLPPEAARAPAPRCVVPVADGWLVLDDAGRVLVLDRAVTVVRQWRMPESASGNPEGICRMRDGRIVVADTHYHRLVFFDANGTVLGTLGGQGREPGRFGYPIKVVQDEREQLLVAEYGGNDRVQTFTRDGTFVRAFGSFGTAPGCFQRPSGLVCDGDTVWVADAMNNRVQAFGSDGGFRGVLVEPGPRVDLRFPYDLALGPDGVLYTAEYAAGRVTAFARSGELVGSFGGVGRGAGQLATPWGLGVDANGIVLVADTGNRRLVELRR
jgi:iron(III) transport system ATP-binding protein